MPAASLVPPDAPRRPSSRTVHGDEVSDDYAWMADRADPMLLAYLQAENEYAASQTAHLTRLEREIYEEIRARTKESDLSVPVRHGGWWYYSRTVEDEQYAVEARVPADDRATRPALVAGAAPDGEQVILDENAEARGHDFFSLGASDVSPDGMLLAYAVDVVGDERFDLRIRDIGTGELLDDAVHGIGYGVAWSLDGSHLFYTRVDDTWRPHEVWRHAVGRPAKEDVRVLHEEDPRFAVGVGTSLDDQWVVFGIGSRTTSECLLLSAADPTGTPWSVAPRRDGVEYDVTPLGNELLVVHNANRSNFEVARAVGGPEGASVWQPLTVTTPDEYVTGVEAFTEFVVVSLRVAGQSAVRILPRDPLSHNGFGLAHDVQFDEPVRSVSTGDNPEAATPTVQLTFSSLVTPATVYDYDVSTRELTLLKRKEVLGGYDPTDYHQRLEWVQTADGERVPLSLVHHVDTPLDGSAPGMLYGYGAYGLSMDPWFSVARLSLLDRGFVFAVAHVRGGSEMGRRWYEQGRLEHKEHTFTDFIACADHLVAEGIVAPDRLAAEGGSAGGLLIGAVLNRSPERFRALHAQVPFVDTLTTMLDPTLPLTVGEWEEWGDPLTDPAAYARIKAYSPYDNVTAGPRPAVLVTTSMNDTRVYVTEPAKWVARLRDVSDGDPEAAPIIFRTELTSGHGGQSGRYDAWHQIAWEWAVLIDLTAPASAAR